MTDKKFNELLIELTQVHGHYLHMLSVAEEEYKRRFGNYPYEVDDDWWIDAYCQSNVGSSLQDVLENAARANGYIK